MNQLLMCFYLTCGTMLISSSFKGIHHQGHLALNLPLHHDPHISLNPYFQTLIITQKSMVNLLLETHISSQSALQVVQEASDIKPNITSRSCDDYEHTSAQLTKIHHNLMRATFRNLDLKHSHGTLELLTFSHEDIQHK